MQAQRPAARRPVSVQAAAPVQAVSRPAACCRVSLRSLPPLAPLSSRRTHPPNSLANLQRCPSPNTQTALKKENYISEVPESLLRPGIDDPAR